MGYDIHITRREFWCDEGEPAITRGEWKSVLANDADLERLDEEDTAMMRDPDSSGARYFWYSDGRIFVKKPNRIVLMKMLAIAEKLGARVIGDDDEIYARDGTPDKPSQYDIKDGW